MKNLLLILFTFLSIMTYSQDNLETRFENSEGTETATYDEVIAYYKNLAEELPGISIEARGLTDSGEPLHLVKVSSGPGNKLRLLINNGIHPGEPDGIDACMMLARNLIQNKSSLLQYVDIYIIPVYNIGGALNRNSTSRVNQQGPEEYGFRGNARNYDLNRDFIKADTRNARSFHEIFHEVRPDLFVDTHVSNGADYQHNITHLFTQHNKLNSMTGEFLHNKFMPAMEQEMITREDPMTPYVNVFNRTPDSGFSQFLDWPRYSTGYTALFNTLGMMIETHMLKPYQVRVQSTYDFLESVLKVAKQYRVEIHELRDDKKWYPVAGEQYPLDWKLDQGNPDTIKFLGYEGEMIDSKVTNKSRLFYNHDKPFERDILYYNNFIPGEFIALPRAYIIPQGWHEVIDHLIRNKAEYTRLEEDTEINVEVYALKEYKTSNRPYEGHYPHDQIQVEATVESVQFRKGDYIFPVEQYAGRYIVETLEPGAHDSFFTWNYFDTRLQRKEGFSPYVFEDIAEELLEKDPNLRAEFEAWKEANEDFRNNWFAQLQFIYEKSTYAEESFRRYPIFRIID